MKRIKRIPLNLSYETRLAIMDKQDGITRFLVRTELEVNYCLGFNLCFLHVSTDAKAQAYKEGLV